MASNCHIGSLFFISGSKVAAVFPRGLFDEKSNISPPLIWLRVPMAKFVFVCVCIVFYLCISCLSMCNCICIWSVFVWFHHQASPAAHSPHQSAFTGKVYRSALTVSRSLYKWKKSVCGFEQACSSFPGWDCQSEETTVFSRFLTFFGAVFLHVTHIYMHDMDILRKNRPQLAFPSRSEASNILVQPWEGCHRLLNWQIQI